MNTLLLVVIIIGVALQNALKKTYNIKAGQRGSAYFFSGLTSFFALLFFAFTLKEWHFDARIIPYAFGFGVAYMVCGVCMVIALSCGPLSLSALISSCSLILPTLYGLFVLGDATGVGFLPGIAVLGISLVLVNKKTDTVPISLKWGINIFVAFLGNGMCTISQKMQQDAFGGAYKNEFMIIALLIVTVGLFVISLFAERKVIVPCIKDGWLLALICGVMNGVVNLFVMILSGKMPVSVMFPLISAGGLIVTFILSQTVYKEKMTARHVLGFALGVVSVILLNI